MPEYIKYDNDGKIINKWYSADPKVVEGKPNIIQISRDEFKALTRWSKVENKKVVEMTQTEKDVILQAEQAVKDAQTAFVNGIKDKLKGLGFDDKETDYLISSRY